MVVLRGNDASIKTHYKVEGSAPRASHYISKGVAPHTLCAVIRSASKSGIHI